ncbi:MAG TPA: BrnT family toxin [Pyrinomonadaceae bacterium]|nr:BrnT family toxin [Pyrinomonadaceae bacterium]
MSDEPDIAYLQFEWNAEKAKNNLKVHGKGFEEAATVFDDPLFIVFRDPDHSIGEQRYIIIGTSIYGDYLLVSFTERGQRIRIISARELNPKERRNYEKRKEGFKR